MSLKSFDKLVARVLSGLKPFVFASRDFIAEENTAALLLNII